MAEHAQAQRSPGPGALTGQAVPDHVRAVLRTPASPLSAHAQGALGQQMGHDFSRVRVHGSLAAVRSAALLGGSAYAVGSDIVWGRPELRPESLHGRALLVHELAHVIQQRGGGTTLVAAAGRGGPGTGESVNESAARAAGAAAAAGRTLPVAGRAPMGIACAPLSLTESILPASMTYTGLVQELEEIKKYQDAHQVSSPEMDNLAVEQESLTKELGKRQAAERKPRAPQRGRAAKRQAAQAVPRSLTESFAVDANLPDAELNEELDAIHASLERGVSARDRRTLLAALPDLDAEKARRKQAAAAREHSEKVQRAFAPSVSAKDGEELAEVLRAVDAMRPSGSAPGNWTLYRNGEFVTMTDSEHTKVIEQIGAILAQSLRSVEIKAQGAVDRYQAQRAINKDQWIVSGVVHFFGGIDDPWPEISTDVRVARINASTTQTFLDRKQFTRAADFFAKSEQYAVLADRVSYRYVEDLISTAGTTVTVLEITRDAAFAADLALGAAVAAPLIAGAGTGLGLTGAGAATFNIAGTGLAVAAQGTVLRGGSAAGGVAIAGGSAKEVWQAAKTEGRRGAIEGLSTGLGGGVAAELGTALKVGQQATRVAAVGRTALAQGGGNAVGSGVGTALGGGSVADVAKSSAIGFGVGVVSAPASALGGTLKSPVAATAAHVGISAVAGGGQAYAETGDLDAAFRSAAVSGASAFGVAAAPGPARQNAAGEAAIEPAAPARPPTVEPATEPVGGGRLPADFAPPEDPYFTAEGPVVGVPVNKAGTPARVLEMGAGPENTNLGLPSEPGQGNPAVQDRSLVDVTRTDIVPREGVGAHDATTVPGPALRGNDSLLINNPRGFDVDIAAVGQTLRPGGRMVVQGRAELAPGMRGTNGNMNRLMRVIDRNQLPPGYEVVEVVRLPETPMGPPVMTPKPADILGGPFNRTGGGPVSWPNTRITIEKTPLPQSPAGDVTVNIGGAGAPHEPAHAVNLNPQVPGTERTGIPNHINAPGEDIAGHFAPGSVDEVVGHNLPPHVVDWTKTAPGSFTVLRPGGRFKIYFKGANADANVCASALSAAGFTDVKVIGDVLVQARKPDTGTGGTP